MFIVRSASLDDLEGLYELSTYVNFINLPSDKEIISKKIKSSLQSFTLPSTVLEKNHYLFVLEDLSNGEIAGVSMIHSQHGTEDEPHFFLKVDKESKFSQTINTGFIHGTLNLGYETNGPTEIGGLVLNPKYRGHPTKLGKLISFVRFLYMGLYPNNFKEEVLSELMPPFDKDGNSPLWEAIGRNFLNMDYQEADVLSRSNKEFILSLFPSENIYTTLLPLDARNAIGKVGEETIPVKKMLEDIGFKYTNEVDPFDGGPHYKVKLKDIKPIQSMLKNYNISCAPKDMTLESKILLQVKYKESPFAANHTHAHVDHGSKTIFITNESFNTFQLTEGQKSSAIFL